MKVSWIKYENDDTNFLIVEKLGLEVIKLKDPEEVDNMINKLVTKEYRTVILSDEIAGFSEDIITKYNKNKEINIIIARRKE